MNTMSIMNDEGDTKVSWDPDNAESVEAATLAFNRYRSAGYQAFAMTSGTQGEQMDAFDPGVSEVLFIPQMQGG